MIRGTAGDGTIWGSLDGDYCNPYRHVDRWHHSTRLSFHFGFCNSFGFYGWWWPFHYSYWYPYWYRSYYVPVYYPVYTPSTTTVIVDSSGYVPAQEIVTTDADGQAPEAAAQAPAARSSTSIAAERYLTLGDRAFRSGDYTSAVQYYAKAVDFAPDDAALYLVLGDALFAAGDYHYAAFVIRKALELDPMLAYSTVDKHDFYPDPAEFDEHLATLETYLLDHPSDRDARLVLAVNYLFANRAGDSMELLRRPESSALVAEEAGQLVLRAASEQLEGSTAPGNR